MEALPCSEHPGRPAPKRCSSCARWLCVECWRFNVDGLPWCAPCVALIRKKKDRLPVTFALTALLLAAGFAVAAVRGGILNSSWAALLVAVAGFGLAALLVPAALKLPRFVEAEVVLVAWLGILWVCLAVTLYRGARLGDDHVLHIRAPDFKTPKAWYPETEIAVDASAELLGCIASEGCPVVGAVFAFAMLVLGASWLLAELLFPAFFLIAYTLLRAALTRVTNDAHECARSVPRALIWGFLWSGLYTAPLAAFVALLHWAGHP